MLRITLRDGEKAIVNGAVLRSVGRTQIVLENHVAILRGSEVMRPEDATTPARRLYFACQLAYIDPENREAHQHSVLPHLSDTQASLRAPDAQSACVRFANEIAVNEYYRALAAARELVAIETALTDAQAA